MASIFRASHRLLTAGCLLALLAHVFGMAVVLVLVASVFANPLRAETVIDNISVGTAAEALAVNSSTNRIFVAGTLWPGTMSAIDGVRDIVVATISAGSTPDSAAVNPLTNRLYVAADKGSSSSSGGTLTVIDGATNAIITTLILAAGKDMGGIAVNPNTNRIYVTNRSDDLLYVLDGSTNELVATVPTGDYPWGIAVNSNTNRIYVANAEGHSVSVVDGLTNKEMTKVPVGVETYFVAVNPTIDRVYVDSYAHGPAPRNRLAIIDGKSSTHIADMVFPNTGRISGVAVNSVTNRVYVARTANDSWLGWVAVIDGNVSERLLGDLNGDGTVNMVDVGEACKVFCGLKTCDDLQLRAGDLAPYPSALPIGYGDGQVALLDAIRISRRVAGLEPQWP